MKTSEVIKRCAESRENNVLLLLTEIEVKKKIRNMMERKLHK
ncbi:hypothetical protein [Bacillus paranthracis]|nr:hypothetical protein [Bacillus paranthracis]